MIQFRAAALMGIWMACGVAIARDEPVVRTWTSVDGRAFEAGLLACDGLRATLRLADGRVVIVPHGSLRAEDGVFLKEWRRKHPRAPLIVPAHLPPWPVEAPAAPGGENSVREVPGDARDGAYHYESAHFAIGSDAALPLHVVRDLAAVLEATRNAVVAMPLGLISGWRTEKYEVSLHGSEDAYLAAGGAPGTGGIYDGRTRRMLLLLPNLGIQPQARGSMRFQHGRNLFVLKHEVTHQLLEPWRHQMPTWLDEGFSECVAAMPFVQGRYRFANLDSAMRDYLLKWQPPNRKRELTIVAPERLMEMSRREWDDAVSEQSAYDLYNSAGLLAYYFLRHDGAGNGAGLAAYFDALRRGVRSREAEAEHLLRSRTYQQIATELQALARRLGITLRFSTGK